MLTTYILIVPIYLLSILGLAWRSLESWRQYRHTFYLALYAFLIATAVIGAYAVVTVRMAGGIALLAVVAIYTVLLQPASVRVLHHNPWLWRYTILGSLVVFLLSGASVIALHFVQLHNQRTTEEQAVTSRTTLTHEQDAIQATVLDCRESLLPLLTTAGDRRTSFATTLAQRQLDFGILISSEGTVLIRSQVASGSGDNFFQESSWLTSSSAQSITSGIAQTEEEIPALITVAPLEKNEHVEGYIVAGRYLTDEFLTHLSLPSEVSWAVVNTAGVVASHATSQISTLVYSKGFIQHSNYYLTQPQDFHERVRFENTNYVVTTYPLTTLDHQPLQLLSIRHD